VEVALGEVPGLNLYRGTDCLADLFYAVSRAEFETDVRSDT